ncbi:MAG: hypothetical protein ABIR38_00280 [Chthoniobacterales bacterium]
MKRLIASTVVVSFATLVCVSASASQLLNISTRAIVSQGEIALIGGFITIGNAPKRVILRALGPSLALPDSAPPIPDPVLELHRADGTVVVNDNWRETQEQEIMDTGLAPVNDLDSAIVATLPPGAYTAVLRGKGTSDDGSFGTALVEVYDLDQAADSILANISSRGYTLVDHNVMIGGIILGPEGTGDSTLVIRGLGPSLFAHGVSATLYDPTIELFNRDGISVAFNDNWEEGPDAGEIAALGLNPAVDREAALKVTLAAGSYTVVLRGTGVEVNLAGVALVEAYYLP